MTDPEQIRQQKAHRLQELSQLARKRYLDAGGNPSRYANEQQLTNEERQEFQTLLSQVFDCEYINQYKEKRAIIGYQRAVIEDDKKYAE